MVICVLDTGFRPCNNDQAISGLQDPSIQLAPVFVALGIPCSKESDQGCGPSVAADPWLQRGGGGGRIASSPLCMRN